MGIAINNFRPLTAVNALSREFVGDRKVIIELGDTKVPESFLPQKKILLWDNEVNFSMRGEVNGSASVIEQDGKIKYQSNDWEIHQYELPNRWKEGGSEFEWVLLKKPLSNVLVSTVQTKGLVFYKQRQKDIGDEGIIPEEAEGSYDVYHATQANNKAGLVIGFEDPDKRIPIYSKNYYTGMAFRIERPKAIAADGSWVWCELDIDQKLGLLTVTVPWEFLNAAQYPIAVDPTFGYTTFGVGSSATATTVSVANTHVSTLYTASTGDTITDYNVYLQSGSTAVNIPMSVYSMSGGLPASRGFAGTSVTITGSAGLFTSSAVSQVLSAGVTYTVATGLTNRCNVALTSIGGTERSINNGVTLPASWTNNGTGATRYSQYVTYTSGGGGGGRIFKLAGPGGGVAGKMRGLVA